MVRSLLKKRGVGCKTSTQGKKLTKFLGTTYSQKLFSELYSNQSTRLAFNYMIKNPQAKPEDLVDFLVNQNADRFYTTSFLKKYVCSCGETLDILKVWELTEKTLTCKKCRQKTNFHVSDAKEETEFYKTDVLQLLERMTELGLFVSSLFVDCPKCGHQAPFTFRKSYKLEKLLCPKCDSIMQLSSDYFIQNDEFRQLNELGQGYWLEWYVVSLMKKLGVSPLEHNLLVTLKDGTKTEVDVVTKRGKKIMAINCFDRLGKVDSSSKGLEMLDWDEFSDKIIYVTTGSFNKNDMKKITRKCSSEVIFLDGANIEQGIAKEFGV